MKPISILSPMLRWLFRSLRKKKVDLDAVIQERWETHFSLFDEKRFEEEKSETYASEIKQKALHLSLKKKNVFAWILDPYYRYRDVYIEADLSFGAENGYCAAGFVLKYADEENYYYVLVSNKGYFRFDLVFNGEPASLIQWTPNPLLSEQPLRLRIICHGSHFSFFAGEEWIGEVEDERIDSGRIGFAAQNYDEKQYATFSLHRILIESRPLEVETHFSRWNEVIPARPEFRIELAKTLLREGQPMLAVIQIKKALKQKKASASEFFLLSEALLNLRLYEEAYAAVEKCLEADPTHEQATIEKANLLYLLNRFLKLRDYLNTILPRFPENELLHNLYGNTEYCLGNWLKASEHYIRAFRLNPNVGIFALNAAKSLQRAENMKEALSWYLTASRIFFREENYDELYGILPKVLQLDPYNREVRAFEGKILFHEGKYDEAEAIFSALIDSGYDDSALYFLEGMILLHREHAEEALPYFEKAAGMEPGFPLYWFRVAETKRALGLDARQELLKALALDENDIWILNLAGLYHLDKAELETAYEYFRKAREKNPQEPEIALNLSEVLYRLGKKVEAFEVLDAYEGIPKLYNHKGNLLCRDGAFESALRMYEKGLILDPDNTDLLENYAGCCIELELYSRADEILGRLIDKAPSARVFKLIGDIARIKGDLTRAEIAYRQGLELYPEDTDLMLNLAALYVEWFKYEKAKPLVSTVLAKTNLARASVLLEKIRAATEKRLVCSMCGKEWWVPKNIDPQPPLRIHGEPPGDSPAGSCPECGKVYCVSCMVDYVEESRFVCPHCRVPLKLSDDYLKYLVKSFLEKADSGGARGER